MDTSTDFPPLPSMQTDSPTGGKAPITGSKTSLRAREEASPNKPDAQRPKPTVVAETPKNKQGRRPIQEAIDSAAQANPKIPREEQEEEQEELEQEDSCYIKIQQDKYSNKELVKINRGELVMAFTEVALEYELDDPIPDRGVGRRGPTGPYIIYLSEPDADKLLKNVATIFVGQGDNRVSCSLSKHVTRLTDDPAYHVEPDESNPVHITHYLDPTSPMFLKVNTGHLKKAWQALGCRVTRANRENTKVDGIEGGVQGLFTESIHLNVQPMEGELKDFSWPSHIEVRVKTHSKNQEHTLFLVPYAMDSHPGIPEDFCLRRCHKEKPCDCDVGKRRKIDGGSGSRSKPTPKANREAFLRLLQAKQQSMGPSQGPACPYFAHGKCVFVKNTCICSKGHPVGSVPASIECALGRGPGKVCKNGPGCRYSHSKGNPERLPSEGDSSGNW